MWAAVRPGGVIVVEDADFDGCFTDPQNAGHDFYQRVYTEALRRRGGDAAIGRKLYRLCLEAGIPDPEFGIVQGAAASGEIVELPHLTLAASAEAVIAEGIASAEEVERARAEMEAFGRLPGRWSAARASAACGSGVRMTHDALRGIAARDQRRGTSGLRWPTCGMVKGSVRAHLTLLQSGNVVLDASVSAPTVASRMLEAIEQQFGMEVRVVVRTAAELAAVVEHTRTAASPSRSSTTASASWSRIRRRTHSRISTLRNMLRSSSSCTAVSCTCGGLRVRSTAA